jgi:hypothetical protein
VERLSEESVNLRNRLGMFKNKFKTLLETELDRFNTLSAELFPDAGNETPLPKASPTAGAASFDIAPANADDGAETKTFTNLRIGDGA